MKEFVDFLGSQPPYDALDAEDLERLARSVEVEYVTAGSTVVDAGGPPLQELLVVRTGAVEVVDHGHVLDELGTGDTFGHVSLLSGLPPRFDVRAREDTLLYRLPDPRRVLVRPAALRFGPEAHALPLLGVAAGPGSSRAVDVHVRPPVWCDADEPLAAVAAAVTDARQSCALVRHGEQLGIVTDSDFRSALARAVPPGRPVREVASFPAVTVEQGTTVASALVHLVDRGVHHLVVTSPAGRPVGVIRSVDLTSAEVREPLLVRKAIEDAADPSELQAAARLIPATAVQLHRGGVPATQVAALLAAVREALLRRLVALTGALQGSDPPTSLLVLGSSARREVLPLSDLDTALAWADPADPAVAPDPAERLRAEAEQVLAGMERCGLRRCPDGANATNPLFSKSLSQWQHAARRWTTDPTVAGALLLTSIVADSRPVTGRPVGRLVQESVLAGVRHLDLLDGMVRLALAHRPPTGFVRGFVVESSGEHRGALDLKRGGLLPVVSLGRFVAVALGDPAATTPERLQRGRDRGLLTADEADTLTGAFEHVFALLLGREVEQLESGDEVTHFLDPHELDPLRRRYLRESFRAVAAVQSSIEREWRTRWRGARDSAAP